MQQDTNHLTLFLNNKQKVFYFLSCFLVFFILLGYEYGKYLDFNKDELYFDKFEIINIYNKYNKKNKNTYLVLKLQNDNFHFYTSVYPKPNKNEQQNNQTPSSNNKYNNYKIGEFIDIFVLSKNISFIKFLSGFYTQITDISHFNNVELTTTLNTQFSNAKNYTQNKLHISNNQFKILDLSSLSYVRNSIKRFIYNQHQDKQISNLFSTLFLATPLNKSNREFATIFHISHLLAISGFHITFLIAIFSFVYITLTNKIYAKFPYANKIFHSLIISSIFVFAYLFLTNFPPSLIRSFFMFIFALVFLYSNIKIFSFFSLIVVVSFILALFPKLLFSLSFWFSIFGVFYIFLFVEYFSKLNKILFALLLNFWLFFALLPIAHFYFYHFSLYAFVAPLATLLFYVFYPLMLLAHIVGWGGFFDEYIILALNTTPNISTIVATPSLFFYVFISFSLLSIYSKVAFYVLNALGVYFVFYLLYFI